MGKNEWALWAILNGRVHLQSEMKLEPVRCSRCLSMNAHYAQYCAKCSMILNEKAAMEIDESVEKAKASPEYGAILEALRKDLGIIQ